MTRCRKDKEELKSANPELALQFLDVERSAQKGLQQLDYLGANLIAGTRKYFLMQHLRLTQLAISDIADH